MYNPCFVRPTLSPGLLPTSSLKAWYFLLVPHCGLCVYAAGAHLSVGSRVSRLTFSLLLIGLSLAPSLVALVPVVLRDAHGLAPAGRRKHKESQSSLCNLYFNFYLFPPCTPDLYSSPPAVLSLPGRCQACKSAHVPPLQLTRLPLQL